MAFTFFFRDLTTLEGATRQLTKVFGEKSKIKVWDAGCASGEEVYSLVMLLAEQMGYFSFANLEVWATDVEESSFPQFEKAIKEAVYPEDALKRSARRDLLNKYCVPSGKNGSVEIDYSLRKKIKYQQHDLLSLKPIGSDFNLIVCKNVLLHFKPEQRVDVLKMFHDSLSQKGILAMEQSQDLPEQCSALFMRSSEEKSVFIKIG